MENKELLEYRQKIKGLSLKELNDILTHINREKLPEKHKAIQEEIALRTGTPVPEAAVAAAAPVAVKRKSAEVAMPRPELADENARVAAAAPAPGVAQVDAVPAAAPRSGLDKALMLAAALLLLAAVYFLLIPFVPLPGVEALRALLG